MRQYTIAKTLALFLGVLSVIARSLPERRSEINVRTPGASIPDVGDSKQRLEELGHVMRDTTPEKPRDFRGHQCLTTCGQFKGPPLLDDCKRLFKTLQSKKKTFTVGPGQVVTRKNTGCAVTFDGRLSNGTFIYDDKNLVVMGEWLARECITGQNADVGFCKFDANQVAFGPFVRLNRELPSRN